MKIMLDKRLIMWYNDYSKKKRGNKNENLCSYLF